MKRRISKHHKWVTYDPETHQMASSHNSEEAARATGKTFGLCIAFAGNLEVLLDKFNRPIPFNTERKQSPVSPLSK